MKTVFVNPELCIGCRQCEFACAVEHSSSKDPVLAVFEDPRPHSRIHVEPAPSIGLSFPNRCRHCDPAPCQQVCPTGTISRSLDLGIVLMDTDKCIACAMCAMVCPFDAVTFHAVADGTEPRVVAVKCDGCIDRVSGGLVPACVEACKVGALVYGEINDVIQEGRLRESTRVLSAAFEVAQDASTAVAGWRTWGEDVARVRGGVA